MPGCPGGYPKAGTIDEIVQQDLGVEVRDGGKGYSTARLQDQTGSRPCYFGLVRVGSVLCSPDATSTVICFRRTGRSHYCGRYCRRSRYPFFQQAVCSAPHPACSYESERRSRYLASWTIRRIGKQSNASYAGFASLAIARSGFAEPVDKAADRGTVGLRGGTCGEKRFHELRSRRRKRTQDFSRHTGAVVTSTSVHAASSRCQDPQARRWSACNACRSDAPCYGRGLG